jgi:hypothetical protein
VLALLGDIVPVTSPSGRQTFNQLLLWCKARWEHVLFVPGNHEYSCRDEIYTVEDCNLWMQRACQSAGCIFLDKQAIVLYGVRVLGAPLWSHVPDYAANDVETSMNDYECVYWQSSTGVSRIRISETNSWFARDRDWLRDQLERGYEGATVVLTHHAPTPIGSSDPKYGQSRMSHAYCTPLEDLFPCVKVWAYGHTHFNNNRAVQQTELYSNQLGYPIFNQELSAQHQRESGYDKSLVISVDSKSAPQGVFQQTGFLIDDEDEYSRDLDGIV